MDLTVWSTDGVQQAICSVQVVAVTSSAVVVRSAGNEQTTLSLDGIVEIGVRDRQRRSLLDYLLDLLSLTR